MNFYKRYLGDYARDTAHLSLMEHGAYQVLLDTYYATDGALPADPDELYRIARAMTPAERKAVDRVAGQFFAVNGDGSRHNKRADEEIAAAVAYADAQAMRANKRWQKQPDMPAHKPRQSPADASHSHRSSKEAALPPDPLWGEGIQTLTAANVPIESARTFIGKLLKSWPADVVADALAEARGTADPKGYATKLLQAKPRKGQADYTAGSV